METNNTTAKPIKPIEIFRPGTFTAVNGQSYSFSADAVRELAETYNPEFSDAPFVVGHPKLTSPRFGRAASLSVNKAGVLCAIPEDVVPEFAEAVNAGHYPKVSASIFMPEAPGNPTPGKHYLRHIGFLGGAAPAVKGLKSVEFSASEEGIAEFGYEDRTIVSLFRGLRDWLVESLGMDKAQSILPDYSLDGLMQSAIADDFTNDNPIPAFSDPTQEEQLNAAEQQRQLDERAAAIAAEKLALDQRTAELAKREARLKKTEHADFAEALCVAGTLLPAQKASVVEILTQLDAANQVADFAAGDEHHGKTGAELFKDFLSKQPKQVEFGRVSPTTAAPSSVADFAAPMGEQVDQERLEMTIKAQAYMKAHPGTTFIDAVGIVQLGH